MTLNFYTLGVIYLIYSFLGWVGETIVATIKGKSFANRGAAAGPFCFVYGTTAVLLAAGTAFCWNGCTAANGGTTRAKSLT